MSTSLQTEGGWMSHGRSLGAVDLADRRLLAPQAQIKIESCHIDGIDLISRGKDPQLALTPGPARDSHLPVLLEIVLTSRTDVAAQLFWNLGGGWSEDHSRTRSLAAGRRETWNVLVPPGARALRLDPSDRPGHVTIHSIRFFEPPLENGNDGPWESLALSSPLEGPHWLRLPAVRQHLTGRLSSSASCDWATWLVRDLCNVRGGAVLHLDAPSGPCATSIVRAATSSGLVRRWECLCADQILVDGANRPAVLPDAIESSDWNILVSTGALTARPNLLAWFASFARSRPRMHLVLLELSRRSVPDESRRISTFATSFLDSLPPGWVARRPMLSSKGQPLIADATAWLGRAAPETPLGGSLASSVVRCLQAPIVGVRPAGLAHTLIASLMSCDAAMTDAGLIGSSLSLIVARGAA